MPKDSLPHNTVFVEPSATQSGAGNRSKQMRLRAAWMYFIEEKTQSEIADHLGVGRVTVVRLLSDARQRNEVKFFIEGELADCMQLSRELEVKFGMERAIVVPLSDSEADATLAVSAATGAFLSEIIRPGLKIGVGWGRTLWESLSYLNETTVSQVSVVSLLGGITKAKQFNPSEFAWRFSNLFQAECYMMTAPAIVNSPQTKTALIEHCGLGAVFERAKDLDVVLTSVGDMDKQSTPYRYDFVSEDVRRTMEENGAVGEFLFNYFDINGRPIDHALKDTVMSVPPAILAKSPQRIIASGGLRKALAIYGSIRALNPTVLITDEHCARGLINMEKGS